MTSGAGELKWSMWRGGVAGSGKKKVLLQFGYARGKGGPEQKKYFYST